MLPWDLKKLFEVLSTNRQLQHLNISWNNMQEMDKQNLTELNKKAEVKNSLRDEIWVLKVKIEHLKQIQAERDDVDTDEEEVAAEMSAT